MLQAMTTYYTREQWEESWQGIDSSVLNSNVYQAEYDGQLIGVPIASTERVSGEFGDVLVSVPIPDRVEKLACLAVNWARLHRLPAEQIKVALILHNMPPGNDRIGCVYGLDAPASLQRMLAAMKQEGIQTDLDVSDGEEIIQAIRRGLTNDNRFLSEKEMLRRSADTLDEESYMRMFGSFPVKNQRELERDWGRCPGTFFTAEQEGKRRILIPGLLNGNLFIGRASRPGPERSRRKKRIIPQSWSVPTSIWPFTGGWRRYSGQMFSFIWERTGLWNGFQARVLVFLRNAIRIWLPEPCLICIHISSMSRGRECRQNGGPARRSLTI